MEALTKFELKSFYVHKLPHHHKSFQKYFSLSLYERN